MKTLLRASVAIGGALILAGPVLAADLGPKPVYKAPPPVVAPAPYNWTGFYIGGHFGGGWARNAWEDRGLDGDDVCESESYTCVFRDFGTLGDVGSHNAIGPLGGFQVGYNWQAPGTRWVFGIEGQYSFADLKGDHQNSSSGSFLNGDEDEDNFPTVGTIHDRFHTKVTGIATIAGRIGITSDAGTLFYVKGGAAYARNKYNVTSQFSFAGCSDASDDECQALNGTGSWSGTQNRWGWMVGTGLEFALFGNWSAKIEYDFLGFGRRDVILRGGATASCDGECEAFSQEFADNTTFNSSRRFSINQNIQVIKLGLNYRFNWGKAPFLGKEPVVARY